MNQFKIQNLKFKIKQLTIILSGCLVLNSTSAMAAPTPRANAQKSSIVPTIGYEQGKRKGMAPDWSKITWSQLPALGQAGYLKVPPKYVSKLGYDPSRSWNALQKSDSVIMLGDADDEFRFADFTLEDIAKIVPQAQESFLQDIGFIKWQTPASLVKAIPSLGDLQVSQVKPIRNLLEKSNALGGSCLSGTISQCLSSNPLLGKRLLGEIDLTKFDSNSIPFLRQTPIRQFKEWQRTYINQVPGLNQVPLSQMPNPIKSGTSVVGIASTVFGQTERGDPRVTDSQFVSGSVERGDITVNKACEVGKQCSYLELGDLSGENGSLYGKRWASGSSQQVKGGYGFLAVVNGGKEPTGRLVHGNGFKVAMIGANESTGTADFGLFFRICVRPPFQPKTCTPYFIGPVPWIPVKENDLVILGTGS